MSMRLSVSGLCRTLVAAATLAALPGCHASAADLDYGYGNAPPPIAESKVEFGSGWYIRGDVGATRVPKLQLANTGLPTSESTLTPSAPTVLFGGGSEARFVGSHGAGYQVNRFIRGDLMFDYHQPVTGAGQSGNNDVFCPTGVTYPNKVTNADGSVTWGAPDYANGGCTGYYKAQASSYDVLANAYIDIGTWYHVTPYVGAGVGLSFGHFQTSSTYIQANNTPYQVSYTDPKFGATFSQNFDRSASGTYYNFAFAGMAGVAIDVYAHTKLDIGYRYLNLGHVASLGGTLYEHEVRAGLRYMIDN